jgi:tetratricopeptide (TPR) repeat protein
MPAEDPVIKELTSLETAKHSGTVEEAKKLLKNAIELRNKKDYEKADNLFKKALLIFSQRLGEYNLYSAACFHNLGILSGLRNRVVEASWYMEKCKDIYVKIKGPDSLETARAWSNMGYAYLRRRRVKVNKGLEAYQEALRILKSHFGENNIQVARAYADISRAYALLDDGGKAEAAGKQAMEICKRLKNPEAPGSAMVYYICSAYYIRSGQTARAIELIEQAVRIREKSSNSEDSLLLMFRSSLKKLKPKADKLEMY